MRNRLLFTSGSLALATAAVWLTSDTMAAQSRRTTATVTNVARTPDGHPDLQGTFDVATITPLERPAGVTKLVLTDKEAAALARH